MTACGVAAEEPRKHLGPVVEVLDLSDGPAPVAREDMGGGAAGLRAGAGATP